MRSKPSIQDVLDAAIGMPPDRRIAYIERELTSPEDRREARSLLEALEAAPDFLDHPAIETFSVEGGQDPMIGGTLGAYRVESEIGRGGMAIVYEGVRDDGGTSTPVAIKIPKEGLERSRSLDRFRHEGETLKRLVHDNIVTLVETGEHDDGRPFMVMERIEGVPIDVYCREQKLQWRERLGLFIDVCKTVEFAHRHLVLHRDLKPANILITEQGKPRLLDFGIAKLMEVADGEEWTRPGEKAPLTLRYASPEQLEGRALGTASDVWALGALLFLLLTDKGLYPRDESDSQLEARIREGRPLPFAPSTCLEIPRWTSVRPDLEAVVRKTLEVDLARRYPTVQSLVDDLERALDGVPPLARPGGLWAGGLWSGVGRWGRRHWVPLSVSAIVLVAIGTSWVSLWRGEVRAKRGETLAWRAHAAAVRAAFVLEEAILQMARDSEDGEGLKKLLLGMERPWPEDVPEAEARVRLAFAKAFLSLGEPEEAIDHAIRAGELAQTTVGLSGYDEAAALEVWAEASCQAGREDALDIWRRALDVHRAVHGTDAVETRRVAQRLSEVLGSLEDDSTPRER